MWTASRRATSRRRLPTATTATSTRSRTTSTTASTTSPHWWPDAGLLVKAAGEGKLATRADATKHQGEYRKIVEGVNQTLDAVIKPLNVSAEYVDRISKGDIPPKITDSYNGDFNEIKNNLNNCIDNITALVTDAGMLVKAAG